MKRIICAFLIMGGSAWADARLISVTGMAERSLGPDMARVQVNVWAKADSAKAAQSLANDENEHLKKTIGGFDIPASDITTTGYELAPDYKWDEKNNVNKIIGYTATQSIRIALKKSNLVGKFLDALIKDEKSLKSGIMVQGVAWDLEKREEIEKSLLAEAVKSSEDTAQILAKAARVKIKGIYRLSPQMLSGQAPMYEAAPMMVKSAGGAQRETTVFSGEIKVRAQVSADYEIE
jgi:uncharacterized protein YggE